MKLGQQIINEYIFEEHLTDKLKTYHVHLCLKPNQVKDTNGIKRFNSMMDIRDTELNDNLRIALLDFFYINHAKYIKVDFPEKGK